MKLVFFSEEQAGVVGAFFLDVRTLTFCQPMVFFIKPLKVKLLAGEQKATEVLFVLTNLRLVYGFCFYLLL